jgi:hypothetical protein
MTSSSQRLKQFLKGYTTQERVVSPMTDRNFAASVLRKRVADITTEDQLVVAEVCGYDPVVIFDIDWGEYDPALKWKEEVIEQDENSCLKRKTLQTPWGPWQIVYSEPFRSSPEQIEFPFKGPEDFKVLLWYAERISHCGPGIAEGVQQVRELIKNRALISLRIGYPHELLSYTIPYILSPISLADRIYYWYDFPELYKEAMAAIHETQKSIVAAASAAGCDSFFFGSFGTEIFSPQIFREAIGPYAREMCEYIHEHGAFSYYHACGHNRIWLERGYLNMVHPTLLEGFTPPPAGTVDNLEWARQVTHPDICTRGNLDIEILRDSSPEVIEQETHNILDATQGYRHIVGTS